MSVQAMAAVFEHSESTGTARLVLLALADRADEHGVCWPSKAKLAPKVGRHPRTVQRALAKLRKSGELIALANAQGSNGATADTTPLYWVCLPGLDGEPDQAHERRKSRKGRGDRTVSPRGDNPDSPRGDNSVSLTVRGTTNQPSSPSVRQDRRRNDSQKKARRGSGHRPRPSQPSPSLAKEAE